jgi:hypothetical protein
MVCTGQWDSGTVGSYILATIVHRDWSYKYMYVCK